MHPTAIFSWLVTLWGRRTSTFEGERNAAGQPEGRGTMRWREGGVYEGEFAAGEIGGIGVFHAADGRADVSAWGLRHPDRGRPVGVGVRWSADRQSAWRLKDGEVEAEVSLDDARKVAAKVAMGEADAAIVYASDRHGLRGVRAVALPADLGPKPTYVQGLLRDTPAPRLARAWDQLVRSDTGQRSLRERGLRPVGP